jgi:hypothetical protein
MAASVLASSARARKDTGTDEKSREVKPQVSRCLDKYRQVVRSRMTEPGLQAGTPR